MRGHIRKRGKQGYEYIIDIGVMAAQRCQSCGKRFWVERRPKRSCPRCGGGLSEVEERRRETKAGFRTLSEAQQAMTKALTAVAEQRHVIATPVTVAEFLIDVWLPAIMPTVRPTTYAGYRSACQRHVCPRLGQVKLQRLDGAMLNSLYAHLSRAGGIRRQGGLAPRSVALVHRTLHRALADAVRWGYLPHNTANRADPPRQTGLERELPVWSEQQLHSFLGSVREERLYPLWRFLSMTGCRRGEALGLQWRDLDMEASRVAIRRALIPIDGKLLLSEPKTKRGRRLIALDQETLAVLREQAASQLSEERLWGEGWVSSGYVFTKESGEPLHPERISAHFARLVRLACLPKIPLHGLRHTYASLALAKGVNPLIVSRRLGHSTVAFTLDVYSHVLPQVDAEAAELIAGISPRLS
jgi:integrase